MRKFLTAILFLLFSVQILGQATLTSKLGFDQGGLSLAEVNAYIYRYYPDGAVNGINLITICTGVSSPFICVAAFPAFTPGMHSITITSSNAAGESPKSSAFSFTFVILPSAPLNPRIVSN